MKFSEIYIKNYLQFRDFHLNLTYPDTGKPLDKICFIGSNGTGKTTLINIIWTLINLGKNILSDRRHINSIFRNINNDSLINISLQEKSEYTYLLFTSKERYCFSNKILNNNIWKKLVDNNFEVKSLNNNEWQKLRSNSNHSLLERIQFKENSHDIICYARSDAYKIENTPFPKSDLNRALEIFKRFVPYHDVSFCNVSGFWTILIYQIKKRQNDYFEFLDNPDIKSLTVQEAQNRFEKENPDILTKLAEQWNMILERAGLEFDVENAKIPVQLKDNLEAYIRLRRSKKNIPYNDLSTGIRNFIFQLGHIYALYFNRDIQRGFLLIDEPESSLFPDLQYDLIERYLSIIQNTQFFVATHSPIIAAQFEPAERFVLEFDEDGYVNARLGVSPEGDDPNDLLANDFVVRSLYGKKGIEQWERYLYLRRKIVETEDMEKKKELLREYSSIGNAYNFLPNEISE